MSAEKKTDINYQVTQVDGVSNDLLSRFQDAIDETESEAVNTARVSELKAPQSSVFNSGVTNVKSITQMPKNIQNALPSLNFEQHIIDFSSVFRKYLKYQENINWGSENF